MVARPTEWQDTVIDMFAVSGANVSVGLTLGLTAADLRGATVIRTIVALAFHSVDAAGAWGIQQVHLGIGIISEEAFTANVLPDPRTAEDRPSRGWMYRDAIAVSQNGVGTQIVFSLRADIHGARKIENGALFIIVDAVNIRGTSFNVGITGLIRTLLKR